MKMFLPSSPNAKKKKASASPEVEVIFLRERYRKGDWFVGEATVVNGSVAKLPTGVKAHLCISGEGELEQGNTYRLAGSFSEFRGEPQLKFKSYTPSQPISKECVVSYLVAMGKGRGLGKVGAAKIFDAYGEATLDTLRETPEIVKQFAPRMQDDQLLDFSRRLQNNYKLEKATIELSGLLKGRGFPKSTQRAALKRWGTDAARIIRRDPYRLLKFRGCGFVRTDAMYISLGYPADARRRLALAAWHAVASSNEGHSWVPYSTAAHAVRQINPDGVTEAIELAVRLGRRFPWLHGGLAIKEVAGRRYLAVASDAQNELRLAKSVSLRIHQDKRNAATIWPDLSKCEDLTLHQREAIAKATSGRIGILAGSPGTGKTYTITQLLKRLRVSSEEVIIGAPTGKAAVRVTELLSNANVNLSARTWHSHLGVAETNNDGFTFNHGLGNRWDCKVVIGDEESMKDTSLARHVFEAMPTDCHFLMVGDPYQLLPVGVGAPLRDLIAAGIPCGELREIQRNSGGIVEACAAIRDNQSWKPDGNLRIHDSFDMKETAIRLSLEESDPVWDAQVLVAVNESSPASRKAVNEFLQARLNAGNNPIKFGKVEYRKADKVIVTKNTNVAEFGTKNEVRIYNGEIGKVIDVFAKEIIVQLTAPHRTIRLTCAQINLLDLAYAISVHKSQGSEFQRAIVVLDEYPGAKMVCDKAWLYTAISRGKLRTDLIGKKSTADAMCGRDRLWKRRTFLRETIADCAVDFMLKSF